MAAGGREDSALKLSSLPRQAAINAAVPFRVRKRDAHQSLFKVTSHLEQLSRPKEVFIPQDPYDHGEFRGLVHADLKAALPQPLGGTQTTSEHQDTKLSTQMSVYHAQRHQISTSSDLGAVSLPSFAAMRSSHKLLLAQKRQSHNKSEASRQTFLPFVDQNENFKFQLQLDQSLQRLLSEACQDGPEVTTGTMPDSSTLPSGRSLVSPQCKKILDYINHMKANKQDDERAALSQSYESCKFRRPLDVFKQNKMNGLESCKHFAQGRAEKKPVRVANPVEDPSIQLLVMNEISDFETRTSRERAPTGAQANGKAPRHGSFKAQLFNTKFPLRDFQN